MESIKPQFSPNLHRLNVISKDSNGSIGISTFHMEEQYYNNPCCRVGLSFCKRSYRKNGFFLEVTEGFSKVCVLNYFRDDVNQLTTDVYVELKDNKLLLADDTDKTHIKIKHPPFCPLHHLSPSDLDLLPDDILNRGIDVGAAVILESSDNKILLTRRAKHLRTFPGIWVPPVIEAGLRELYEESGLRITPSQCTGSTVHPVALWEVESAGSAHGSNLKSLTIQTNILQTLASTGQSAYPPKLALGQPKRHHIVIYLYGKLTSDLTSGWLSQKLKLCPKEVGACGWFDRRSIEAIVSASEEEKLKNTDWKTKLTETFRATSR
ncbi:hypothetical protein KUTeg_018072 [Tegillarca granosa]|uniref:Nudix hydrolase domain-containing protein n=1 Tax=Tegillarca granosa TaxID=220873 RepID=A0ABQ9EGS1_TEGGR|nr:hypothetical protein KUTeg_018072 [Tegillarca granosa]